MADKRDLEALFDTRGCRALRAHLDRERAEFLDMALQQMELDKVVWNQLPEPLKQRLKAIAQQLT